MKKTILAVLVVLLAMLAVTCDSAVLPLGTASISGQVGGGSDAEYVTVNIGLAPDRARAMNLGNSTGQLVKFEVVFTVGTPVTTTIRSTNTWNPTGGGGGTGAWTDPVSWTVKVPKVNFSGTNGKVVMFAGTASNVLLAIGETTVDATAASPTASFTMNAITSGVAATRAASNFKITAPTTGTFHSDDPDSGDTNHSGIPVFAIPNDSGVTATWVFKTTTADLLGHAVRNATAAVATVTTPSDSTSPVTASFSGLPSSNTTLGTGTDVTFNLTIDASSGEGDEYAKLFITVPVNAVSTTASSYQGQNGTPVPWVIQGGLLNTTADNGSNTGGAVLLKLVADYATVPMPSTPPVPAS